ncbi:hypothetical protein L1887_13907 [Cichorium endivia]|nr:hypothetical protein L1887_13907 [Cichorium endivia]
MKIRTTLYSPPPPEPPPPPNLLSEYLLGNRDDYHKLSVRFFNRKTPKSGRVFNSEIYNTALHIAASVEKFASLLTMEQLERENKNHNTTLCIKAANGSFESFKTMVNKNMTLLDISLDIPGSQGMMPLYMASLFGKNDMVNYLYDNSNNMTGEFWTPLGHGWVFQKCVEADIFDVSLKIVSRWLELTKSGIVLFSAAEMGNTEFLVELIRHFPELLWKENVDDQSIFHVAVIYSHEGSIYNLLHEIGSMKDMITPLKDEEENNMLHLVATIAKNQL